MFIKQVFDVGLSSWDQSSWNMLFISVLSDTVHCFVVFFFFFNCLKSLLFVNQSSAHQGGRELQEMARLTVGTHRTRTEHMSNCCICGSNLWKCESTTFGVWQHKCAFGSGRYGFISFFVFFLISSSPNKTVMNLCFLKIIFTDFQAQNRLSKTTCTVHSIWVRA